MSETPFVGMRARKDVYNLQYRVSVVTCGNQRHDDGRERAKCYREAHTAHDHKLLVGTYCRNVTGIRYK